MDVEGSPSGTVVTLVLTDIEGSTRAWQQYPNDMGRLLAAHNAMIREVASAHRGVDLQKRSEGDGRFLVFQTALDALNAAVALQEKLSSTDWSPLEALPVRIAIHSGEAELREEDYFGTMVNRCARMRGACHGGQVILSEATKALIGENLPQGIFFKDLGVHRFKDLQEPERIYQIVAPRLASKFPKLNSLSPETNNLPVQLSSFIGREKQIEAIHGMIRKHRIVTLTGTGGGGKTRLAIQTAAEGSDDYPEGVWFASLVGVQNPSMVMQAIAEALPISLQDRDALTAIKEEFGDAKALLILDNCEHVLDAATRAVNEIVLACTRLTVLATSREPLKIRGEGVFEVPPMASKLKGQPLSPESLRSLESIALLRDRFSSRVSGQDILKSDTAESVARICELLDGIPLAIEQAAANLAFLSPEELVERLEQAIEIFERDEIDVEERHVSMEASIEVSLNMLSDAEKLLFFRLSVFVGGWSLKSAEHVCTDEQIPASGLFRLLERLVNRSLVVTERATGVTSMRFRMLEPIRQFSARRRPAKDDDMLLSRLFEWSKLIAHQAYETGLSSADGRYLYLLNAEHDNIRSSLRWARGRESLGKALLEFALYMHRYWLRRGLLKEGSFWLQSGLEMSSTDDELRADALNALGIHMWQRGEMRPAMTAFQESWDIWERLGNRHKQAMVASNLGGVAFAECDYMLAAERFTSARDTFRSVGDDERLATALENLGVAESLLGRLDLAEAHLEESVDLHEKSGHLDRIIKAKDSLCGIYLKQAKLLEKQRRVLDMLENRLLMGEDLADPFLDSNILEIVARLSWELNQPELAVRAWGGMQKLVEESELVLPPNQITERLSFTQQLEDGLGQRLYRACIRAGRALSPIAIIRQLIEFLIGLSQN